MTLILALAQAATSCVAQGQTALGSARDFIRIMADPGEPLIWVTCGRAAAAVAVPREAARQLAVLGKSALPEIERAIASVEKDGSGSMHFPAIGWLALVYAKVDGVAAYPTLQRLLDDPRLNSFRYGFRAGITVSLDLSAYVGRSLEPDSSACRAAEPRDALAKLIFARETGDIKMLEESLGPLGLEALKGVSFKDLAELSSDPVVGFRLENRGAWSRPEASLEDPFKRVNEAWPEDHEAPSIQTEFVRASGQTCGRIELHFLKRRRGFEYSINNSDVAELLRMVEACAAH